MKTKIGVFFGGRSTEHEISIISANQAINAFNPEKYEIIPIYISKEGKWYTGRELLTLSNYRNIPELLKKVTEIYMKPIYGDFNIYNAKSQCLAKRFLTLSILRYPYFTVQIWKTVVLKAYLRQ